MSRSLNEIEGLCKRAARGAGYGWGVSEEAGKAVRWLASHNLPGPQALGTLLQNTDGHARIDLAPVGLQAPWHARSGQLCPLASGTALNDCADDLSDGTEMVMQNVMCPVLILPFAAWASLHLKKPLFVAWSDTRLSTDGVCYWGDTSADQISATSTKTLFCGLAEQPSGTVSQPTLRGTVPQNIWQDLSRFAHRTYAPATEASRLLGAGAGTSDND